MNRHNIIILTALFFVILSEHSTAKVYKWVDENGKIHFSDKPPQNIDVELKEVKIKNDRSGSGFKLPAVSTPKTITNSIGQTAKSVLLEHVLIKLNNDSADSNTVIGKAYKFNKKGEKIVANLYRKKSKLNHSLACIGDGNLDLGNANYIVKLVDFIEPFESVFSNNSYKVVNKTEKRFNMEQNTSSDLSVGATINEIKLAHCGRHSSANLNVYSQNATYIKVHWEIFDNLSRKVVYEIDTEGSDNHLKSVPRKNGAAVSFSKAFQQSVEGLLSKQEFVDVLTNNNSRQVPDSHNTVSASIKDISLSYGSSETDFSGQVEKIKQATATIRTTSGHGSGFVISHNGYVLTNQHVANDSSQVIVIIQGKEYVANLVKSDSQRDVALLKIAGDFIGRSVKISASQVKLGEKIYVIGTPLDEELDFSISSGIISAKRELKGNNFYQTDAAVNPGNSGGPVFDEKGNVIGITVSGYFTKSGGSRNINYLIPIDDALQSFGIK